MKTILIPMADGAEDIELISIIDILRRAKASGANLELICASITNNLDVKLDSGLIIKAETTLAKADLEHLDGIVLAGGFGGMSNLKANKTIIELLQRLNADNKLIAAICASPMVLGAAGVLSDEFTCYPGCESNLSGRRLDLPVVIKDNIITSAGPITASYFALAVIKELGFIAQFENLLEGLLINKFGIKF